MVRRIYKKSFSELSEIENCTFGPLNKPIATVEPGEVVEFETYDCFANVVTPVQTLKDILEKDIKLYENPVTGPIWVRSAESGDTLTVEILDIKLPEEGVTTVVPCFGALEGLLKRSPPITKFHEIRDGKVMFRTNQGKVVEIPVKPFVGTIGVAPSSEAISTITPGSHGGNMDCPDICPWNKLYLPIFREGALFGLGDVHAVQGDGEVCGTAVEVPAMVTVKFEVLKGKGISNPRIESPKEIMTVCSAKPLEDATRWAVMELMKWLEEDYGFERYEAYMFLSLTASLRIAQIVDPLYTVVAKLSKTYLQ